jgi:hypothetical protein
MIKKSFLLLVLGILVFGGCGLKKDRADSQEVVEENIVQKIGEIKTKAGSEYLLSTDSEIVNVVSSKENLDNYLKKKIKVTGMFSGSTLYVDKIEIVP